MSLPNVRGCYHMPSGPEQARQVRLESLGAENIQGTCACLSANMWGSPLEKEGMEISFNVALPSYLYWCDSCRRESEAIFFLEVVSW